MATRLAVHTSSWLAHHTKERDHAKTCLASHKDETAFLGDLFRSDADLYPDEATGVLEVRLHTLANPRSNRAVHHLLEQLNAAKFT